jgi:poly(A) polymerase
MQPRLERRIGRSPHRLLEHLRFRAAYDFLLLRCSAGEADAALGDWWTRFIEADAAGREALQAEAQSGGSNGKSGAGGAPNKRKRRRRKPAAQGGADAHAPSSANEGDAGSVANTNDAALTQTAGSRSPG